MATPVATEIARRTTVLGCWERPPRGRLVLGLVAGQEPEIGRPGAYRALAMTEKESLDEQDYRVLARFGYAVARAQLWEFAMLKLVETQRHDPDVPLDDRWPEVETWLTKWKAGHVARQLSMPEEIATDLITAASRRNVIAHRAWPFYIGARGKRGDAAVADYSDWLDEEARMLGCISWSPFPASRDRT